jgi:hypothetical protein
MHERGLYTSMLQFILNAAPNLVSVVTGSITKHLGWKYLFHIQVACIGFQTVLLLFFCPETTFVRDQRLNLDKATAIAADEDVAVEKLASMAHAVHVEETASTIPTPKTFWQSTTIYTGKYSDENILHLIVAPFAACANIAGLWVLDGRGALSLLRSVELCACPDILHPALQSHPRRYRPTIVRPLHRQHNRLCRPGLEYLMDFSTSWATHKNNGVYEPEYRLILTLGGLLTGAGLMGFGTIAQDGGSYYDAASCYGIAFAGVMFSIIGSSTYALDAYRDICNKIFIMNSVFKNFPGYSFTCFVNDWTARAGPKVVFTIFGGAALAVNLSGIVLFVFRKRYRSFWHRHNVMQKLHIRTHPE